MISFTPPPRRDSEERRPGMMMRLKAKDRWQGYVNSDNLVGLYSHFEDKQSTPCIMPAHACRLCATGRSRRYRAYVGFFNLALKRHHVLELTEGAATELGACVGELPLLQLRGLWLEVEREPQTLRGRMRLRWDPTRREPFRLPEPLDVERIVARLYES